jgi:hypothetical protein
MGTIKCFIVVLLVELHVSAAVIVGMQKKKPGVSAELSLEWLAIFHRDSDDL